ncbi:MAG: penicillin-binding protein 1A [Desulfobacterales bacterium]|nr:penicillin-binding protein 1A [Desulfobacterales bacterium]
MAKPKRTNDILKKRKKHRVGRILFRIFLLFVLICTVTGGLAAVGLYYYISRDLPKISSLKDYHPPIISTVYADDGRKIGEFFNERRIVVPLTDIPDMLIKAFVAAEDSRFYTHQGIDLLSIARAFIKNIEAGSIVQGGSTITQQVTKSFLLTPEKSYTRKMKEAILAYRIEKALNKGDILYLYLNQIYLGHGAYGVEAAAENYFGKTARDMNLAECAMLAGLPQAPSRYSPFKYPDRAKQRQIYVLNRMVEEGYITNIEATEAITTKLDIRPRRNWYIEEVPFYTEYVRQYIEKKYGAEALYNDGLQIYTAVNIDMQRIARKEVEKGLLDLDKRQGYRGPLQHLAPEAIEAFVQDLQKQWAETVPEAGQTVTGVVVQVSNGDKTVAVRLGGGQGIIDIADMDWARKPNPEVAYHAKMIKQPGDALQSGDVVLVRLKGRRDDSDLWNLALEQVPKAQGALLCIEAETGNVKSMVGGRDFRENQFNRALQSRRQPGSAFKPIIYAAAIDKGYTPATVVIDSPIVFKDREQDFKWKPKNYGEKFYGPTLLRQALAKSRNVITIKIVQDIGIDYVMDYAHKLGITSTLNRDLSMALGSSGVSLFELVSAYSVFTNHGFRVTPCFVTRVLDRNGNELEKFTPAKEKVIDPSTAFIMTSLLEGVVQDGTGWRAKALNRPVAGKTGTTNDLYDAWFMGFTPEYTAGVWVGFDEEASLGQLETGSKTASPIWVGFMEQILADKPVQVFQVPEGVVFTQIDAMTGLLPVTESPKTIFECFKEGTVPTEYAPRPGVATEPEQFFKMDM